MVDDDYVYSGRTKLLGCGQSRRQATLFDIGGAVAMCGVRRGIVSSDYYCSFFSGEPIHYSRYLPLIGKYTYSLHI